MVIASAPLLGFAQEQLKSGISLENLDRTANPGESFYQFACGGWMKNNPLPAAYSRYGSFDQLAQQQAYKHYSCRTGVKDIHTGQYRTEIERFL